MGARRIRREQRRVDMANSRQVNGIRKVAERERRRIRMIALIKQGKLATLETIEEDRDSSSVN